MTEPERTSKDIKEQSSVKKIVKILLAVFLLMVFLSTPLLYLWSLDAPPIPNDYTMADIQSADPEYNHTYDLLLALGKEENSVDLTDEEEKLLKNLNRLIQSQQEYEKITRAIDANSVFIEDVWQRSKKARDIIEQLAEYPQIADLTEPEFEKYDLEWDFWESIENLKNIYSSYIVLHAQQDSDTAAEKLTKFDSVFRKLSVNSRNTIVKMICLETMKSNIAAANCIVNSPQASPKALNRLKQHFVPFTKQQLSLRTPFIFEYISLRNAFDEILSNASKKDLLLVRKNSTLRIYRNFFDEQIYQVEKARTKRKPLYAWPEALTKWKSNINIEAIRGKSFLYKWYNPIGNAFLSLFSINKNGPKTKRLECQIYGDLFQVVLNKRFDEKVNIKPGAYSSEIILDMENNLIYNPEEEIRLLLNPEVFGR